jgi:hypothetical protein
MKKIILVVANKSASLSVKALDDGRFLLHFFSDINTAPHFTASYELSAAELDRLAVAASDIQKDVKP